MANKKIKNYKTDLIVALLAVILVLVVLEVSGIHLFREYHGKFSDSECEDKYLFINPRFACGYENKIDKKGYSELKARLDALIESKKMEKKAVVVAVWFRDLEGGPTFGINDRFDFIPASLLKLPLVMTFLELAEHDPGLLNQPVVYSDLKSEVLMQTFIPVNGLVKEQVYTIDKLIYHAIVDSDNIASQLLYEYLLERFGQEALSRTYRDLGILDPGTDFNMAAVNTKEYGSIFRMLFNVSYLSRDGSEKLLSYLGKTRFQKGLRRGVPDHIAIAHKFGERFLKNGEKQLHDCGIIYYPENPYQLCIMTRGSDFNELSEVMADISGQVYAEFDSRRLGGGIKKTD